MKLPDKESTDVEFKKLVDAVSSEDIVAFANCLNGGVIYTGILENKKRESLIPADVIGCNVHDSEKQKLLSKAQSCIPPIPIDIEIVEICGKRLFRVKIPSSHSRPHCTRKGSYTVRGDSRTNPLAPDQLLSLFIEKESGSFIARFHSATEGLAKELATVSTTMREELAGVFNFLNDLDQRLESSIGEVSGRADDAFMSAEETASVIAEQDSKMEALEERLQRGLDHLHEKVNALLFSQQSPQFFPAELLKREYIATLSFGMAFGSTNRKKREKEILALFKKSHPYVPEQFLIECFKKLHNSEAKRTKSGKSNRGDKLKSNCSATYSTEQIAASAMKATRGERERRQVESRKRARAQFRARP